ncbi:XRE family transcriptional regulator [Streptomyces sp. SDr-06]|uniref:helix-turn-helix domain-containing protein n=1 Tax=Streptomyces sp. SDr-06 TaxID=2267702 RepID=UPI000DE8E8CF|nr:helix-turn-helix transcriptional regulator [Streptomyces sp. SDr-06]RCH64762.1 XRE family transcriptional regulator [Streptomyces sp. SDr-06]
MATTESEQLAALLRELKDRSGRSYGVLAGRLHMSTSTLHRYCNGDAVPNEYAPVERLARLCGATPEESVELHRRWILADEARRRARGTNPAPTAAETPSAREPEPAPAAASPAAPADRGEPAAASEQMAAEPASEPVAGTTAEPVKREAAVELPDVVPTASHAPTRRGRLSSRKVRLALIGAAVVALAVPAVAVASLSGDDDKSSTVADAKESTPAPRTPSGHAPSGSPSAAPSPSAASPSASVSSGRPKPSPKPGSAGGAPVSVGISSYDWETPCGKFYLLDQKPGAVPPPPTNLQDRRSWARALNGVDGEALKLELTVTGKSAEPVVITGINVRVVGRQAPLNWTAYSMGTGCGSGIVPYSFDINLDAAQPVSKPVAGQQADTKIPARDFPFKVSTSDPEVFDLNVYTQANDVTWYLEVSWTSGDRSGKVRVDDNGKPFRTSAVKGRPAYEYRPDTNVWDHLETG